MFTYYVIIEGGGGGVSLKRLCMIMGEGKGGWLCDDVSK